MVKRPKDTDGVAWPRQKRLFLSLMSILWLVGALGVGLASGPDWLVLLGQIGAVLGLLTCLASLPKSSPFGYPLWASLGLLLNLALIGLGASLDALFIHPPPATHLPPLTASFKDPSGAFRLKLPTGWMAEPQTRSDLGTSLHLRPTLMNRTAGIAEVDILVRPLGSTTQNIPYVVNQLVKWIRVVNMEKASKETREISIWPERVTLPDGSPGLHLKLEANRWWIPIREDVLYAAKPGQFLCMIACSGLAAYSSVYYPLSVKLYESIEPLPQPKP